MVTMQGVYSMSFANLTPEQAKIMQDRYFAEKKLEKTAELFGCLHDACPNCGGTGIRKDGAGLCFHGISCACPKCSFRC